jgi:hypothetical protein
MAQTDWLGRRQRAKRGRDRIKPTGFKPLGFKPLGFKPVGFIGTNLISDDRWSTATSTNKAVFGREESYASSLPIGI